MTVILADDLDEFEDEYENENEPSTSNQQLTTGNQQPTTGNRQLTTDNYLSRVFHMSENHILIVTTEPLPLPGCATSGAGLRAWGLARGLEARGLQVTLATLETLDNQPAEADLERHGVRLFTRPRLTELVAAVGPDAVVMQHWGLMDRLGDPRVPLAVDLAGPHLLERRYWDTENPARDRADKLAALRRADFVCCSGAFQRHYFLPYLAQAGWDVTAADCCPVIPFSIDPQLPAEAERDLGRIVYGGYFLPWQNPATAIEACLEALEQAGRGTLEFFGGVHPSLDVSLGKFAELEARLAEHPQVNVHAPLPYTELVGHYARAGFALDLLARNPERELAFTTRTVVYLWCGLPVIYNNYSELSGYLKEYGAGATLDPDDGEGIRETVADYLAHSEQLEPLRENARRLVAERLDWTRTIEPLARWCAAPTRRERPAAVSVGLAVDDENAQRLEADCAAARSELEALRGKWIFKLHRKLGVLGPLFACLVYLAVWPVALFLSLVLRGKSRSE